MLQGCDSAEFERMVVGSEVGRVDRRGKWVVIELAGQPVIIVIQPRMTGGFWLVPPDRLDHVRLTFLLEGSDRPVWFSDCRRLGKIAWHASREDAELAFRRSHGPDALEITRDELIARIKGTTRSIKPTLMDQKVLAGIGNIYADEVLFASGIHPERRSSGLTRAELERLHGAIGVILARAIEAEGSSFDEGYRTVLGLEGGFLAENAMYGRGGLPCRACGETIIKTKIAGLIGRPTHYCPNCQPLRRRK
jgi:formamidopyrimidine-DNA glycosylase